MIIGKKYNNWKIYYDAERNEDYTLGKDIIERKYLVEKILKDTVRNYVALIKIQNKKYILKEIRSEITIPQRKIQTFFKKGEAVTTLINGRMAKEEGLIEQALPVLALVKKNFFIKKSYILMEYIKNEKLETSKDLDEVIKILKKIHSLGRVHGDANTSNFIKDENGNFYSVDTQLKRSHFFNFRQYYDILTLKEDLLIQALNYDVDKNIKISYKNIGYLIAKSLKKLKKLSFIKKIRSKKKELREKGWKV